jgi:hypothetical protein
MGITNKVDESAVSIGRRYARNDELGTPFAVTIDFQTAQDQTITLRERDSCKQIREKVNRRPFHSFNLRLDGRRVAAVEGSGRREHQMGRRYSEISCLHATRTRIEEAQSASINNTAGILDVAVQLRFITSRFDCSQKVNDFAHARSVHAVNGDALQYQILDAAIRHLRLNMGIKAAAFPERNRLLLVSGATRHTVHEKMKHDNAESVNVNCWR